MIALLISLAFAQPDPSAAPVPTTEERPDDQPDEYATATAEDLLNLAVDRMGDGDFDGARLLIDQASERNPHPDVQAEATYIRANTYALGWQTDRATALYAEVYTTWPDGHRAMDAHFRHAHMTARGDDLQSAANELHALGKPKHFAPDDRAKLELSLATWSTETTRDKRAIKNLRRALKRTDAGSVSYYEARAWTAWATVLLDQADALPLGESQKQIDKAMSGRDVLVTQASHLLRHNVELKEPEWILAGVLRLSSSYESLADDMVNAPVPVGYDEAAYRAEVRQHVMPIRMNALKYLEKVREMVSNLQWSSPRVHELDERYQDLLHTIRAPS